ncbi:MAG: hypothetical protein R3Y29_07490 [bacterium]
MLANLMIVSDKLQEKYGVKNKNIDCDYKKNGKVSEEGTHHELLSLKGDYHHMVELQNKSLNWVLN